MTLRAVTVGLGPQRSVERYAFTTLNALPLQIDGELLEVPAGAGVLVESAHRASEATGWLLVAAGLAALVLPGPGLLFLVAGLAVLSLRYPSAKRILVPVKAKSGPLFGSARGSRNAEPEALPLMPAPPATSWQ
ncbi:hypothetical protein GCM10023081_13290 [Arthrobacter ginkgonis]|uniref:Uncharacterized protein n=1 Tax=Arthrobacter ginkgonis TaxID=1630594 RepID=A0ABP7C3L4_9MICC